MAAGVTDRAWDMSDVAALIAAQDAPVAKRGPYKKRQPNMISEVATWLVLSVVSGAATQGPPNCFGEPPAQAIMTLPEPLAKWGSLVCTEYGYVISNHYGWIWTNPGAYSPVFIPAQMVKTDPVPLGKWSYFTKIEMVKIGGDEFKSAYDTYHYHYAADPKLPDGYRLDLQSVSGDTLTLYFFDYGTHAWGMWCPAGKCRASSSFMILNMSKKPK